MDQSLVFIILGFLILVISHLPLLFFNKTVKNAKVQILIDKPVVFAAAAMDLIGIGYLIYSIIKMEHIGLSPLYVCLVLGICLYVALTQLAFAFSEKDLYVGSYLGCKKYNIDQLHVITIEKIMFNIVLIKAEVKRPNGSNAEIILRFSKDNYQKYGAIFQKRKSCSQSTDK